mgnify:CR=1 FL=1
MKFLTSMFEDVVKKIRGADSLKEAEKILTDFFFVRSQNLNFDNLREERTGVPEVVFGENKRYDDIEVAIKRILAKKHRIIITRLPEDIYVKLKEKLPEDCDLEYHIASRLCIVYDEEGQKTPQTIYGKAAIFTAGSSDLPAAEECAICCREFGVETAEFYDVGVAAIHRLFDALSRIRDEDIRLGIVFAGMDGALPSVIAGLVDFPVIAVPTSSGYGVSLGGIAPLLTMLNSCAPGVAVLNIDNGFGAAVFARKYFQSGGD